MRQQFNNENKLSKKFSLNTIKASIFEGFESRRSSRSLTIFILADRSVDPDRNLKMRTKIWGRKKWELCPLLFCLFTWFCFCNTCKKETTSNKEFHMKINNTTSNKWNSFLFHTRTNTCLGLAPPRRTSNKVAHKLSVCGNLNNLSAMAEKIGCILKLIFLWLSERDRDRPTAILKNLAPFFSDGRPTKSLPRNCKLSNLIGSYSLRKRIRINKS